jgi:hypothetical protein
MVVVTQPCRHQVVVVVVVVVMHLRDSSWVSECR